MFGSLPWFSDLTLGKLTGAGATTRPRLTMPFLLVADAIADVGETACRVCAPGLSCLKLQAQKA